MPLLIPSPQLRLPCVIPSKNYATDSISAGIGRTKSTATTAAAKSVSEVAVIQIIIKESSDLFPKTGECREVEVEGGGIKSDAIG